MYDKLESLCRACWECSGDRDPPASPLPARVKLGMIKQINVKECIMIITLPPDFCGGNPITGWKLWMGWLFSVGEWAAGSSGSVGFVNVLVASCMGGCQ